MNDLDMIEFLWTANQSIIAGLQNSFAYAQSLIAEFESQMTEAEFKALIAEESGLTWEQIQFIKALEFKTLPEG